MNKGYIAAAAYALTIPAANYMIGNVGTVCIPDGPCLIPVGFGVMAPSGVLMIGAALLLRDAVHEWLGLIAYRITGKTSALLPETCPD